MVRGDARLRRGNLPLLVVLVDEARAAVERLGLLLGLRLGLQIGVGGPARALVLQPLGPIELAVLVPGALARHDDGLEPRGDGRIGRALLRPRGC